MNIRMSVFETPTSNRRRDWPPDDLVGFIAWFQGKLDEVPEQYRGAARVDLSTDYEDGDCYVDLSIHYYRPETEDETAARLKWEQECRMQVKRDTEANELREYERLKAKFGG